MSFIQLCLLLSLLSITTSLRILFILPCYGGHFGTMSPLIMSLSHTHDVTVVSTNELCRNKLKPLQKLAQFEVVEANIGWGNLQVDSFADVFRVFVASVTDNFRAQVAFLREFMSKNRYDVMVTDLTLDGSLVAAELTGTPAAVLMTATAGGVEHCVDKMETPLFEVITAKFLLHYHWSVVAQTRVDHNLPSLVSQNNFYAIEYQARFPCLVAMSPKFYPKLHKNVPHIFIGGARNETHYEQLSPLLKNWLDADELPVIYLSLGTVFKLDDINFVDFVKKARQEKDYRFIWSLSTDMQKSVPRLKLESDEKLLFSSFLPQFTLLGHPKVKIFVTHGGMGSITDLIKRRKPSICSPQLFDQHYNCRKLSSLGLVELSDFSFSSVNETIRKMFAAYGSYVTKADQLANDFDQYEKTELIEKFLKDVASKGQADVIKDFGFDLCSPRYPRAWLITKICLAASLLIISILITNLFSRFYRRCRAGNVTPKKPKLS